MSERVWLEPSDVELLEQEAGSLRNRLLISFGAKCGFRVEESVSITPDDFFEEVIEDMGDLGQSELTYWGRVEGKKTNQEASDTDDEKEKKVREAWIPSSVWKDMRTYVNENGVPAHEPVIQSQKGGGLHKDSARKEIKKIARRVADRTGRERFEDVSSHDLRAHFANQLIVEKGINPRIVMNIGGWGSWESIKPYLDKPTKGTITDSMTGVGWS